MKSKSTPLPKKPSLPSKKPSPRAEQSSLPSSPGPMPWVPAEYQVEAASFLVRRAAAALFLEPGLRKTSIVLAAFCALKKRKMGRRLLVVAPPRVAKTTWPEEVAKWKEFAHLRVAVVEGANKEAALASGADVLCISYNLLPWLFDVTKIVSEKTKKVTVKTSLARVRTAGIDILAVDELSKARNTNSLTYKILKDVREGFDRIYGMTGSPAPNSLEDLFGVMYVIDGGHSLGAFITHYRTNYFYPTGFGGYTYALQPGAEKKIYKAIAPFVYRMNAADYVKLPELVENVVKVHLPPDARKTYDEMEEDFFTELDETGVMAVNGGSAYGKCRQIANGALYDNPEVDEQGVKSKAPRKWFDLHDEKLDAVSDLVDELCGAPAIVVYDFHHDLERLQKRFPKAPHIGGGTSTSKSDKIVKDWNAGKIPVLLAHAKAVSHGLNMQGGDAQHVVWMALTDSYEEYDQLIRRLRRSGNKSSHVFSHLIVAKDTVDELTVDRGRKKAQTQKALTDALREYTLRRRRSRGKAARK